jgi:ABC-2 type transport system permease protein
VTAALVFVLAVAGTPAVLGLLQGWAPSGVIRAVAGASLFGHFTAITRGVVDLRDLVYFVSIMAAFLAANAVLIDLKKAD